VSLPLWLQKLKKLNKLRLCSVGESIFAHSVFGENSSLSDIDLSWNKLVSLPLWLQNFKKLRTLRLNYCDSLDFGALSSFLNTSAVSELDLSSCYTLMKSPAVVCAFIKDTRKIKKLK